MLCLVLGVAEGCTSTQPAGRITLNLIEYNRGLSVPSRSDVGITTVGDETRLHDVRLEGSSFYPDDSPIPNAFIKPLLRLDFPAAIHAFTEPYYGFRIYRFFKGHPHWGVGLDFTHLKVFMADRGQKVRITGPWPDLPPDGQIVLGEHFDTLNVSHGVNHVAFNGVYRWMLLPSPKAPDGRLQPFVSGGGGPAFPHPEMTVRQDGQLQRKVYSYQWRLGNWGMGAGAGLRWKVTTHFGLYNEYKWTYSILNNMRFDNGEVGLIRMRFSSAHAAWGIFYGF